MTARKIRKISLYVTIFFLVLTVLSLYKSKDEIGNGTEDLATYDFTNNEGGLELIEDSAYVFEKEYNLDKSVEEEDSMALALNEIENEAKAKDALKKVEEKKKAATAKNKKEGINKETKVAKNSEKEDKTKEEKSSVKKKENSKVKMTTYVVKKKDTIYTVSKKTGVKVELIIENNPDINKKKLKVGDKLKIPSKNGMYYTVRKGETLSNIAEKYNVRVKDIVKVNELQSKKVKTGTKIFIENPDMSFAKKTEIKKIEKETLKLSKKSIKFKNAAKMAKAEREEIQEEIAESGGGSFKWPCSWKGVSSPYGSRLHPVLRRYIFHEGVDLKGRTGDPVYAAKSGVVTYSGWMSGYGKLIIIDHGNGYSTRYAHLSSISASKGESVERGSYIGAIGSTGRTTGPHLHFEIRKNGSTVDPMKYR